jgi:hypothetical protein
MTLMIKEPVKMKYSIIIVLALFFYSCASLPQQNDFLSLYIGITPSEAIGILEQPVEDYSMEVGMVNLRVLVYQSFAAEYEEKDANANKTANFSKSENYFLVFMNDNLIYHGLLYEFLRHRDKNLNEIGLKIRDKYQPK